MLRLFVFCCSVMLVSCFINLASHACRPHLLCFTATFSLCFVVLLRLGWSESVHYAMRLGGCVCACMCPLAYRKPQCVPPYMYRHTTNKDKDKLTVSPVLKGVLALEKLASGVVSLTDSTGVQRGLGAQTQVTAHCLDIHKQTHIIMQCNY